MRFVAIFLVLMSIPGFMAWLRSKPEQLYLACFAFGLLPFIINSVNLDAALISWARWPGHTKGFIITPMDTLALALILTGRSSLKRLPLLLPVLGYFFATVLSIFFSRQAMASEFYTFQTLRIMLIFIAVAGVSSDLKSLRWIGFGLATGAIYQAVFTIIQRGEGALQASGTMGHQNLLGMMLHFSTLPLLAMILAGERNKIIWGGVLAGLLAVSMGASRGSIGFAAIGMALLVAISLMRSPTPTKWKTVGLGALALAVVAPLALAGLDRRFEANPLQTNEYDERAAFQRAARLMWSEHPMGVGANEYVVIANSDGYSTRGGVAPIHGSRSAHVHQIYLLHAAEMGWVGMFALIFLFGITVTKGLRFALVNRNGARGEIVLGASVAVLAVALQGLYEWVFMMYQTQYLFAVALGIIAGNIRAGGAEVAQTASGATKARFDPIVAKVMR